MKVVDLDVVISVGNLGHCQPESCFGLAKTKKSLKSLSFYCNMKTINYAEIRFEMKLLK